MAPPSSSFPRRFQEAMLREQISKLRGILAFAELRDSTEWKDFSMRPDVLVLIPWEEIYLAEDVRNLRWFAEFLRESAAAGHPFAQCILGIQKIFNPNEELEGLSLLRSIREQGIGLGDYGYGMFLVFDCLRANRRTMSEYVPGLQLMMEGRKVNGREIWTRERGIFVKALQVSTFIPDAQQVYCQLERIPVRLCHRAACRGAITDARGERHYRITTDGMEVCSSTCCALLEAEFGLKEALADYARVGSPISQGSDNELSD